MPREAKPHYLRRNDSVWSPPAVIYADTETRTVKIGQDELLTLRCWAARFVDRRPTTLSKPRQVTSWGNTAAELADWIERMFAGRKTVWLFCHNLSFDLATTRLPLVLADAGWDVSDAAVGGKAPWVRMSKGSRTLTMVDSGSWMPAPLGVIAEKIGMVKPELPDEGDDLAHWLSRCRADVDILAEAMGQILDWWDEHGLGHFNITGPACGWNAFRHVFTVQRVVIDPAPAEVEADRLAVHGGRRGVWRIGDLRLGPLIELDIRGAYPRVAAELPLPMRRGVRFDSLGLHDPRLVSSRWGVVAEVELETDTPRWPIRWRGATWYPVGRFKAHLAGPEIAEAARLGCLRSVGPGQVHQLGSVLMSWARWVLDVQDNAQGEHPAVAQMLAKHWGRTVIGKFSAHGFDKIEMGPSPVAGWGYSEGWDHTNGARGGYVDMAGRRWWVANGGVPENSYPAVHAWVESHVRMRLTRVLDALGDSAVIQCDTDGLIITREGLLAWERKQAGNSGECLSDDELLNNAVSRLNLLIAPLDIRVKRSYEQARVLGPQHIEIPGERRFSGLPRLAKRVSAHRYAGHTWPKLQWQLGNGDPRGYVRPLVETVVKGPFANGWVLNTGRVLPVRAIINRQGETELVGWQAMPAGVRRRTLAEDQHRVLRTLIG